MAYNGWANYETWCVNLWLSNNEPTYRYCRTLAEDCRSQAPTCRQVQERVWQVPEAAKFLLADRLKEFVEDRNPLCNHATVYTDLLNAALSEVNWHEVAEAFLEE